MNPGTRVALGLLLVAGIVGLGAVHDATAQQRWPYPANDDLNANYEQYVGEKTLVSGPVTAVNGSTGTIRAQYSGGTFALTVTEFDVAVQPGGSVQVYGTLRPGYTIEPERIDVVNPAGSSNAYKYVVSVIGAAVVLVQFFRHWRVNLGEFHLEARSDG
jgi:hypothetical protein